MSVFDMNGAELFAGDVVTVRFVVSERLSSTQFVLTREQPGGGQQATVLDPRATPVRFGSTFADIMAAQGGGPPPVVGDLVKNLFRVAEVFHETKTVSLLRQRMQSSPVLFPADLRTTAVRFGCDGAQCNKVDPQPAEATAPVGTPYPAVPLEEPVSPDVP